MKELEENLEMWKRTAWNEVSGNLALLEPKTSRFSFGLLIYISYRFTTIYGSLHQQEHANGVTEKGY